MTLMEHGRLLCIQPTGYGKSLLYQLPSVLLDGMTLVISPLLALMRDQLSHLNKRFNIQAASINSDQDDKQNASVYRMARAGQIKILFAAPEQLGDIERFNFLLNLPISLLVVDEAHCISTWGHDFRPSYRQIVQLVQAAEQKNPAVKVLGLTATANQKTENDIKTQLALADRDVKVHRTSMDRPNIQLSVIKTKGAAEKLAVIQALLNKLDGDGLIYCATRENTLLVAEHFQQKGVNIVAYHAGFDSPEKQTLQKNFIDGKYKVIAATNALGMGIDKPDLHFIIHFDVPGSITAYYQEVGRCGRDGLPSHGILLYDEADKKIQQHFIESAQPTEEDFENILTLIRQSDTLLGLNAIKRLSGLHPTLVTVIIAELTEQKFLKKTKPDRVQVYSHTGKTEAPNLFRYKNQHEVRTNELQMMLNYGEKTTHCRMAILRNALGDTAPVTCNHCDVCKPVLSVTIDPQATASIKKWLSNRTVKTQAAKLHNVSEGTAILDGKLRSPLFIQFMKQRTQSSAENMGLSDELLSLIKTELNTLKQQYRLSSVISIPSRTWQARCTVSNFIAKHLQIPALTDYLRWRDIPKNRQGELLNNDQRRYNVDKKMTANFNQKPPVGTILLLDDYTGSGATLKEAARTLRKEARLSHPIVPFTIAAVKWKLGKAGMI